MRFLAVFFLFFAMPVQAQTVSPCDWRASAQAIPEPWDQHTRTFANGNVRLTLMDTTEPVVGAQHLMILSPPYNELGERQCVIISFDGSIGFAAIYFQDLTATYDPTTGLSFQVPVSIYLPEHSFHNSGWLRLTLNQSTGAVGFAPIEWFE